MADTYPIAALLVPAQHLNAFAILYRTLGFTIEKCDQPGTIVFPDGVGLDPMDVYGAIRNDIVEEHKKTPPPG